eukprot:83655_1
MSKTLAASFNDNSIKDADVVKIWEAFDSRKQRLNYMNAFQHSPSELQMLFRVSSQNACDLSHAHLMVDHLVNSVSGFQSLDISSIEDKYNLIHLLNRGLMDLIESGVKKCESRAVNKLKWTTIFPGMRLIFKQKKGGRFSAIDTDKGSIIKICKNIKVIIDSELYPQDFKDLFPQFKGLCIQFNW